MIKARVITEFSTQEFIDYIKKNEMAYIECHMLSKPFYTWVYITDDFPCCNYVVSEDGLVIDSDSVESFLEVGNDNG